MVVSISLFLLVIWYEYSDEKYFLKYFFEFWLCYVCRFLKSTLDKNFKTFNVLNKVSHGGYFDFFSDRFIFHTFGPRFIQISPFRITTFICMYNWASSILYVIKDATDQIKVIKYWIRALLMEKASESDLIFKRPLTKLCLSSIKKINSALNFKTIIIK